MQIMTRGVISSEPLAYVRALSKHILFYSLHTIHSTRFDLPISIYMAAQEGRAVDKIRHTHFFFISSCSISIHLGKFLKIANDSKVSQYSTALAAALVLSWRGGDSVRL